MLKRNSGEEQSLHDKVIEYIKGHLSSKKYDIYINPGQDKSWSIKGEFPDIILTPKNTNEVQFIIEVETSESVTPEEARNQWKAYSELPGIFHIIVPEDSLSLAKQILAGQGIEARVGYFRVNDAGDIIGVTYNAE